MYSRPDSEHLLLRLRRLVAEGEIPASDLAIYFVEKVGQESTARRVSIHNNGHIDPQEWPKGFFTEALSDSIALANEQRRGAKK